MSNFFNKFSSHFGLFSSLQQRLGKKPVTALKIFSPIFFFNWGISSMQNENIEKFRNVHYYIHIGENDMKGSNYSV